MKINVHSLLNVQKPYAALALGSFEGDKGALRQVELLGPESGELARRILADRVYSGKAKELFPIFLNQSKVTRALVFLGLGKSEKLTARNLREYAAGLVHEFKRFGAKRAALLLPSFSDRRIGIEETAQILAESLILSNYKFDKYHSKEKDTKPSLEAIDFLVIKADQAKQAEKGAGRGVETARGVSFARDLGNEPANFMTPSRLAEEAKRMARECGLACQVLDEKEIKKLKMGGLLGVAKGSHEPPRFIILDNRVRNPKKTICLVGKGITFDSGGISLKPGKDMEKMKYDMCGAAAVISSMQVASKSRLSIRVIGLVPTCENLPSFEPQRPGDILVTLKGKTVEVINTDAEGRLILADALTYAEKFKPDAIIDLATLTGMCGMTFGDKCMGLMSNDAKLAKRIEEAGKSSGERVWPLPMWDDYLDMIKGDVADLKNVGPGVAGTITAGKFLEQFVPEKTAWAHLDIAGVAWADSPKPYTPKGATGAGVRLILELLRRWM